MSIFSLLGWPALGSGSHGSPRAIAEPVSLDILGVIDVEKPFGHAGILQHIFRPRLQRQRFRLGQVQAARLVLLSVEDRDRNDAGGAGLAHFSGPLDHRHRPETGRSLFRGVSNMSRVLRPRRRGQRQQQRQVSRRIGHHGIISLHCISLWGGTLIHGSERHRSRLRAANR